MMLLYHGTTSANCENIMKSSLMPRQGLGNWKDAWNQPSMEGFVYLTKWQPGAEFHAFRTSLLDDSDPVILSVLIDEKNLYPDENYYNTHGYEINKYQMASYQAMSLERQYDYFNSLQKTGLVAHKGEIEVSKIINRIDIPKNESLFVKFTEYDPLEGKYSFFKFQQNHWAGKITVDVDSPFV